MTTYDSKIELDLQHLPKTDPIEDPVLYDELLDIHNAIEQLASEHDDCCFPTPETETFCSNYELSETEIEAEVVWTSTRLDSSSSRIDQFQRQVETQGILCANNGQWIFAIDIDQQGGEPGSFVANTIQASYDLGQTWNLLDQPHDAWAEDLPDGINWANRRPRFGVRSIIFDTKLRAWFSDLGTLNPMYAECPGVNDALDDLETWSCIYNGYSNHAGELYYSAAALKVSQVSYFADLRGGRTLLAGKHELTASVSLGLYSVDASGARQDGSEYSGPIIPDQNVPIVLNGAGEAATIIADYSDPSPIISAGSVYNVAQTGTFTFISLGDNSKWVLDSRDIAQVDNNHRQVISTVVDSNTSDWSINQAGNQIGSWLKPTSLTDVQNANALHETTSCERWGWFNTVGGDLWMPLQGVENNASSNKGKYAKYRNIASEEGGGLEYTEVDFSSLITFNDADDNDVLDFFRIEYCANAGRYLMLYGSQSISDGENRPKRLYLRVAGRPDELEYWSDPLKIDMDSSLGQGGALQMRAAGGYGIDYVAGGAKFIIHGFHLTGLAPAEYSQRVQIFDDVFFCTSMAVDPNSGGGFQNGYVPVYNEDTDSFVGADPSIFGVPNGGTVGQHLVKNGTLDRDTAWEDRDTKIFYQGTEPDDWVIGDLWMEAGF